MTTTKYDPETMRTYASALHTSAVALTFIWAGGVGFAACFISCVPGLGLGDMKSGLFLAGAVLGAVVGSFRVFRLKLESQALLCQVQIERHLAGLADRAERPQAIP